MGDIFKIGIAGVLALVAAGGNYYWLQAQKSSGFTGIKVKENMSLGKPFSTKQLEPVAIPGDPAELKKTFIPWSKKALIENMPSNKAYSAGDLLLQQDLAISQPNWKPLGPFRLISVGERVRAGSRFTEGRGENSVTIEATLDDEGNYDAKTLRLLDIIAAQSDRDSGLAIVAIQLDPTPDSELTDPSDLDDVLMETEEEVIQLGSNKRGIIIPLNDVENIPEVLARGSYISFVIRWYDEFAETE